MSAASTDKTKNEPSFSIFTFERFVRGDFASGVKALKRAVNCLSDGSFKRTVAFVRVAI